MQEDKGRRDHEMRRGERLGRPNELGNGHGGHNHNQPQSHNQNDNEKGHDKSHSHGHHHHNHSITRNVEKGKSSHSHSYGNGCRHNHNHHHSQTHKDGEEGDILVDARGLSGDLNTPVSRRARKSPYPLVPFNEALTTVLAHANPLTPQTRAVNSLLVGMVLAEDVVAVENVPGYRASIVDGYAVIAADGIGSFPLSGRATAGPLAPQKPLVQGHIARVTTGAPVPDGADAVVMVEDTEVTQVVIEGGKEEEAVVRILKAARLGENIREVGSDVAVGDIILQAGSVVSAPGGEVGLIASVGVSKVLVHPLPRVAILSTGNELVPHDHPSPIHAPFVRDTNQPTLATALIATFPGIPIQHLDNIANDEPQALKNALSRALDAADIVITTGGVSMGEADLLKPVLEQEIGAHVKFGRVLMKPGKPCTFATVRDWEGGKSNLSDNAVNDKEDRSRMENVCGLKEKLIFSLPGNPVSALVSCYVFVIPAIRKMAGYSDPYLPSIKVEIAHPVRQDSRPEFQRARVLAVTGEDSVDGAQSPRQLQGRTRLVAHGTGSQLSSRLLSMKGANALLRIPPSTTEQSELPVSSLVDAWLIGPL